MNNKEFENELTAKSNKYKSNDDNLEIYEALKDDEIMNVVKKEIQPEKK